MIDLFFDSHVGCSSLNSYPPEVRTPCVVVSQSACKGIDNPRLCTFGIDRDMSYRHVSIQFQHDRNLLILKALSGWIKKHRSVGRPRKQGLSGNHP